MTRPRVISLMSIILIGLVGPAVLVATMVKKKAKAEEEHVHGWSQWEKPISSATTWIQFRQCTNCGLSEVRVVETVK